LLAEQLKLGACVLQRVESTPLLCMDRVGREYPDVGFYGKAEWSNPGGSVKGSRRAKLPTFELMHPYSYDNSPIKPPIFTNLLFLRLDQYSGRTSTKPDDAGPSVPGHINLTCADCRTRQAAGGHR